MWARSLMRIFFVSIDAFFKLLISFNITSGSITTPFPITHLTLGQNMPDGIKCNLNLQRRVQPALDIILTLD